MRPRRWTGAVAAPPPAQPGGTSAPTIGYAPAYYPGTLDLGNASRVSVGVSQVVSGVDFPLQQVPLATVEGTLIAPQGTSERSIRIRLYSTSHDVPGVGSQSVRVRDGQFSFNEVPPGQYRAVATAEVEQARAGAIPGEDDEEEIIYWASTDVSVAGQHVSGLALMLQPGLTVTGRIAYNGTTAAPESNRIRVSLEPYGQAAEAAGADDRRATVQDDGTFEITGVVPGLYRVSASGVSGWTVASAVHGGVDAMDLGLEITPAGQR